RHSGTRRYRRGRKIQAPRSWHPRRHNVFRHHTNHPPTLPSPTCSNPAVCRLRLVGHDHPQAMHSDTYDALRNADRNKLALLASVLPGAGHLLKGHKTVGITLIIGNILVAFIAAWLAIATLGVSLLVVPLLWFAAVAASA